VKNIAGSLGQTSKEIQQRQLRHFHAAHPEYGAAVERALNEFNAAHPQQHEPEMAGAGRPEK
jgi:catalase